MQVSRFTDFSLRALLYLAINDSKRATLAEIAAFYPVSLDHLRKVVHELSRAGFVRTYQGKTGGIELGRDPAGIRIGDVVRHFEAHDSFINCHGLGCRLAAVCTLKTILDEGQEALFESLNRYTLADLVNARPAMVRELYNPDPPGSVPVIVQPLKE